jgi:hypothetical protein
MAHGQSKPFLSCGGKIAESRKLVEARVSTADKNVCPTDAFEVCLADAGAMMQ